MITEKMAAKRATTGKTFTRNRRGGAVFMAAALTAASVAALAPQSARAASDTWDGGGADNLWLTPTNWVSDLAFPGATSDYLSTDNATFSLTGATGTINLGGTLNINSLLFGDSGGDAAGFVIGDADDILNFTAGGGITVNAGVTTAQTIGSAGTTINLSNAAAAATTFTNNGTGLLTIAGNIAANVASGNGRLAIGGSGNTLISGTITKPGAGSNALLKTGSGTLTLTNGSTWNGAGAVQTAFSGPFTVQEGLLLLNGGTHSVTGEAVIGGVVTHGGAGQNAKVQVDAGALNISSWLSVGRGNGTGGVSSDLEINNAATVTAQNLSAGYNANNGANLPRGSITLNDSASLTVTGANLNIGESNGSNVTMTINDTATVNATAASVRIGQNAGTGALIMNGGTFNASFLDIGTGSNNTHAANGTVTLNSGATLNVEGDLRTGFAGSSAAQATVNVNGGTLNVASNLKRWMIIGRWDLTNSTVNVDAGALNLNTNTDIRFAQSGNQGANVFNLNGGSVTSYSDNKTTATGSGVVDLMQGGGANTRNTFNLNGGDLTVRQVLSNTNNGTRTFNFNGGTLRATGATSAFVNLGTGNARANVRNGGAVIDSNGFNITIPQPLLHSDIVDDAAVDGGLTKQGVGELTLTGASTYTGQTTINGGTLLLPASGSISASSGIRINSGTFRGQGTVNNVSVANAASNTLANLGDASLNVGALVFDGAATLDLTTSSTSPVLNATSLATNAAGQVVIDAANTAGLWLPDTYNLVSYSGTLGGAGFSAFTTGDIAGLSVRQTATLINPTGLISLVITGDNPRWTGLDSSEWRTGSTGANSNWRLISAGTATNYVEGDIVLFDNTASNFAVNVVPTEGVAPTSATFASGDYTVTASAGSAGVTGAGTVTKSGSGSVALNSANAYTGGTTLSGGTLAINHAQAIGSGALTISGGTLDNTSGGAITLSTNNAQNWNGDFTFTGSNDLNLGTGPVALSAQRTVTVSGGVLSVDGAISGTSVGITKLGAGKLALGGSNTYSGTTIISEGQLEVTGGTTGALTADIQIGPNNFEDGTLVVSGGTVNANRVIIAGNSTNTGASGTGTVTQTGGTINSQQWFTVGSGVDVASPGSFPTGTYNNSGGTLNVIGQPMEVANFNATSGTVNLSGTGAINLYNNQSLRLGANANAWDGVVNQDGGTVTFYSDAGTTVGGTGILRIGHSGTLINTYTYNLNAGTLTAPQIERNTANGATGIFNLAGGTLKAARANATWVQNLSQFNVSGTPTIDDGGFAVTMPQVIDGSGTLTKQGSGTLTLAAVNNFSGTVNVAAGTLAIGSTGTLTNANVTGGTLDGTGTVSNVTVADNAANTVANGSGTAANFNINSLSFAGAGKFSLETSNTDPAAQVITTSTLAANGGVDSVVVDAANLGGWISGQTYNLVSYGGTLGGTGFAAFTEGTITGLGPRQAATLVNPAGFIALEVTGDTVVWSGAVNGDWKLTDTPPVVDGDENWKLQAAGTATDFLAGDQVIFDDSAVTSAVVISDANISAGGIIFDNSAKNYTIASPGGFGIAAGAIVKNGSGSVTLGTANTYAGGTTLNAGTLNVNNASALGTGAVTLTGGTLDNTSGSAITLSTNNAQSWNGDFTFAGSNDLDMGTGAVTLGGAGTARTVTVNAGTLTVGEVRGITYDLIKQGAGKLVLTSTGASGANAGDGSAVALLNVAAGTLQFNRTGVDAAGSGDLTGLTGLTGGGTVVNGAGVERWLFVTNAADYDFSGTLANGDAGALGFVKRGTATQTLSGANSYTGLTTIDAGTLRISGANSGAGTNATVNAGNLVIANPTALGTASLIRLAGDNLSTLTYATDGGDNVYDFAFGTGTNATIVSDRATPGAGINHTLTTQTNTNGLGGGILTFTSGANVTSGTGSITLNQFNLGSGFAGAVTTLNPTSANVSVGSVKKANNNTAQTLDLGGTTADNQVTGGIANGTTGAVISLTKSNTSTWTLSGENTYTGATTVNGGTLRLATNLTTSSAVNVTAGVLEVASGAGGSRVIKSPSVTVAGGKIDLKDNKLITAVPVGTFTGGAYTDISGLVDTARGNAGIPLWDGATGITTSDARAQGSNLVSIGVAKAGDVKGITDTDTATFAGQTVLGSDTLAMVTYGGDATLDGKINIDDYGRIDANVAQSGSVFGWYNGDFNYDGAINIDDYGIIDGNISGQGGAFPTSMADASTVSAEASAAVDGVSAVPEPASLSLIALGAMSLMRRRRRMH